ncbi:MAG: FAD-binding oxidoreductase [Saprospiraceae bacterium]|nr:FAD-binding oxidoreductase [Saprospiraceae bacterium]
MPLPNFKAGQYLSLSIPLSNRRIKRAYSLAAWKKTPFYYELGIKKEDTGVGSSWLWENMQTGKSLLASLPTGHFTCNTAANRLVFIAGGIGITPLRAMLHHFLDQQKRGQNKDSKIFLFYSNSYQEDVIFHQEFIKIAQKTPDFTYIPIVTRATAADNWQGETQRISVATLRHYVGNFDNTAFYMCANNDLMHKLENALLTEGVEKTKIHYESFGISAVSAVENDGYFRRTWGDFSFETASTPTLFPCPRNRRLRL